MSEQEIREGLRVAVWDEPPLDFDPDALIERAEKVRSRRRALVSVGVGTALVVVSAFALPTLFTGLRPDSANTANSQGPPSASVIHTPDDRDKLADHAVAKVRQLMPDVQDVQSQYEARGGMAVPPSAEKASPSRELLFVRFTDDIGPTALQLEFGSNAPYCLGATMGCTEQSEPDGSKVLIAQQIDGGELSLVSVTHRRVDGTSVTASVFAYNPVTGLGLRKTVPMGVGVLRELATDPQLSWD